MDDREKREERNKRIGWLTSVAVQLLLLILFYFLIAWREPFPPIPEYGIELGFSTSAGATSNAPSRQEVTEEPVIEEESSQDQEGEEITEPLEHTDETEPEVVTQEVPDVPLVEEESASSQDEIAEVSEPDEPVKEKQEPEVEERAVMKPSESEEEEQNDTPGEGEGESQEIDSRAIYGSQGSNTGTNEGASLALAGWVWDFKPQPKDDSDQAGKIVYKIVVDEEGYLVKIETVTSTVSPAVERKYRASVQKLTFSKTKDYKAAALSTGTVTFIIKSR